MTTQPHVRRRTSEVISEEVRSWAARYGLKQKHLAEVLHVSQTQVSARLRGAIAWNADEIDILAETFGISPAELMTPPQGIRREQVGQAVSQQVGGANAANQDVAPPRVTRHLRLVA